MLGCIVVGGGDGSQDEDGMVKSISRQGAPDSRRTFVVGQSILPGLVLREFDFLPLIFFSREVPRTREEHGAVSRECSIRC